jgi:hypothetical protein
MMISARVVVSVFVAAMAVACGSAGDEGAAEANGATTDALSASRFSELKHGPTDSDLAALSAAGSKLENAYVGTYRFNQSTSESHDASAREKRIKEVMHRYMCSFFDESIDIGRPSGSAANEVKTVLSDVDMDDNASEEDAKVTAFSDALKNVLGNRKLDVLSGSASGNNTAGEIMGVYDTAHDEIFYFGFTNCGSDD